MKLVDLVKIDHRFEKSVNLLLDLNDRSKLRLYIPTRSSIRLLIEYLREVDSFSGNRANILVGPYGKGKSHLLLVLLALLSGDASEETDALVKKIESIDSSAAAVFDSTYKNKKLLPVIINPNAGTLAQAFVRSLSQALKKENLQDVVPDSYFSEALSIIEQWKKLYKKTYAEFCRVLGPEAKDLIRGLKAYNYRALDKFRAVYPSLTSGSAFNPVIDDDVISVYRSVNRTICEKYGYDGIYIIFDEFSKYIEGHSENGFSTDMKTLQDVCELCNSSKDEQLHLTCVAHKAIRAYGDTLSKEVKNAFRGVEGRLTEIQFVVSSQNNYELISDAIQKKSIFEVWKEKNQSYKEMLVDSCQVKDLTALFDYADFEEIVVKGAFPLTPLSALLLLSLSEKIAQNERTIFTFLTGKDLHSLSAYVEESEDTDFIGADAIYDYFSQLLAEEKNVAIHNEWLKAEYALEKTEDKNEKKVLKSIAVIHMVNRPDSIVVNDLFLRLATGLRSNDCQKAIESLRERQLIELKPGQKVYDFNNSIGIDIEGVVSDCILKNFPKINLADELNKINETKYILPKKYNQDYYMTRYIRVHMMSAESFLALSSVNYLQEENQPDGYLLVIMNSEKAEKSKLLSHLQELDDSTVAIAIICATDDCCCKVKTSLAITKLLNDKNFINENLAIEAELTNWQALLLEDVNKMLEEMLTGILEIHSRGKTYRVGDKGINRAISEFTEQLYTCTPIINNEMINRHAVTAQTSKARNTIVDDVFHARLLDKYCTGTSAESTIYRACMVHTKSDQNLQRVKEIITDFIQSCKGKKVCFSNLIDDLTKPPIGMRKGTLPIYIAEQIMQLEDMPVIYHEKAEISLDAKLISDVVSLPERHYLYVEEETAKKSEYIQGLEHLFSGYGDYCREIENMNRLARLKCHMQAWYRALPQTATTFKEEDFDGQEMQELISFRKLFVGEPNPRELIFERIPKTVKTNDFVEVLESIARIKREIDSHIEFLRKKAENAIRTALHLSESDDFKLSLQEWYEYIPDQARRSVLSSDIQPIFNAVREIVDGRAVDAIEKLSKAITNFFIEDWTDDTISEFECMLKKLVEELDTKTNTPENAGNKITIVTDKGTQECLYEFNQEELSSSGYFFQNALDDVMDEYGSAVDNNEKIGILMNIVKKLMGE